MSELESRFCPRYPWIKLRLHSTALSPSHVGPDHRVRSSSTPECPRSSSHVPMYPWDSRSFFMGDSDFCVFSFVTFPYLSVPLHLTWTAFYCATPDPLRTARNLCSCRTAKKRGWGAERKPEPRTKKSRRGTRERWWLSEREHEVIRAFNLEPTYWMPGP